MPANSEWFGEPHTLTVTSIMLPTGLFDDGEMEYVIRHPLSCKQEQRDLWFVEAPHERPCTVWTCDVAENENECGLAFTLRYSGTPITEPGTYRIQAWGHKYYVWDVAAYEYDSGIGLITGPAAREPAPNGYHLEAVPKNTLRLGGQWEVDTSRRCRHIATARAKACGKQSAATLWRAYRGKPLRPWGYCPDHLYGNWVEGDQVMCWVLRKDDDA